MQENQQMPGYNYRRRQGHYQHWLEHYQQYDVCAVANGVDLLTIVTFESFDVVITDLVMTDLNGASAAEIMKMQGNTTPVIALTGVSPEDANFVKDKFTRIFHKPINISELFEYVETLLG